MRYFRFRPGNRYVIDPDAGGSFTLQAHDREPTHPLQGL
jgi:hypothetical protein